MTRGFSRSAATLMLGGLIAAALMLVAPSHARAEELRIGFIAPMTGIFAQVGKDMVNGFQMYLDEHGGKLGGAEVKFIVEDDQAKPDLGVTKAKKLVLQDKVHMFVGGVLASTGYALAPVSTELKTVYIPSIPAADDLTQRQADKYPYLIRTGWSSSQPHHPLGQWACDQGYKRMVTVGADYAFGYELVGGFQKAFEDCGGKIVQKIWPALGTKDFGPYIPTIKADADAVFTLMVGPMALQFPKQLRASGYKKPIVGGGTSYDEFALPFMGDEVIGDVSALQYSAALETPKNETFVKTYRSKYGKVPSYFSESNYTTAQLIDDTIKASGGKWPGAQAFVKTMAGLKIDAVRGPVSFDELRNPVQNIYIKKVEKKKMFGYDKAELWNTVIKTYPAVSQFWTYGKAAFLKQPVYSPRLPALQILRVRSRQWLDQPCETPTGARVFLAPWADAALGFAQNRMATASPRTADEAGANPGERPMSLRLTTGLAALALGAALAAPALAEELRIGFIAPLTGIQAQVGKDMVNGFQMYLDEAHGEFAGTKVTLIVEDNQGKPDAAVTKAKKLILQDKVQMYIGGVLASTGYALAPVSTQEKTVYISSVAAADDLTQRQIDKYPYFIRTSWSSSQPNHPYGQWTCDQGYKKIVSIAADYAFGYEQLGGFQKAFEACGGKIIQKIWPPLTTKDFGPCTSRPSRPTPTRSSR